MKLTGMRALWYNETYWYEGIAGYIHIMKNPCMNSLWGIMKHSGMKALWGLMKHPAWHEGTVGYNETSS